MRLFLKLHRALPLLLGLIGLASIAPMLRALAIRIDAPTPTLPEIVVLPTLMASLVGEALSTPMVELEGSAPRGQRILVLSYGLAVAALSAVALSIVFGTDEGYGWPSVARSIIGQSGAALGSAALLGGARAFVLPMAIGVGVATAAGVLGTGGMGAWMLAGDGDVVAWVIAVSLLLIGSLLVWFRSPIPR
ncbi:MAG: hypothetical protein ACR2L4_04070 [Actinomycetota bacterium]